jgi:hypothetical protein
MKAPEPQRPQFGLNWLSSLTAIALLMILLLGCRPLTSKAKGRSSKIGCKPDIGVVKGAMDAGINVTVTVENVGEDGFINIKPELSTSEGEWNRSQDIQFAAGESKNLTYFFDEPTINASNIQCRVAIYPNAN